MGEVQTKNFVGKVHCVDEPVSFDSTFALFLCESDTNNHCCLARRQVISYMRVQRLGPLDFANP